MKTAQLAPSTLILGLLVILWGAGAANAVDSGAHFVQATTALNTTSYYTEIDNLLTDDNLDVMLHVTPRLNFAGGGSPNGDEFFVWEWEGKWRIANSNFTPMPLDTEFNVWIPPPDSASFVHTALAGNISSNITVLDNAATNGDPAAHLRVTKHFDPPGVVGGAAPHPNPIGVFYVNAQSKWAIFNQDLEAMPPGASFNITVLEASPTAFVHTSTGGASATAIDSPLINGNANAIVQVTPIWNPGGMGGVYNDHAIGVFYVAPNWWIFNQDGVDLLPGASFNVSLPSPRSTQFIHTEIHGTGSSSTLYDPLTTDHPNAYILLTQNWNPGGVGGVYFDSWISVGWNGDRWWQIRVQDWSGGAASIPQGASFNVLVPAVDASTFIHTAFTPIFDYTVIDNPLTNGHPEAILHVTNRLNWGAHWEDWIEYPFAVRYNSVSSKWAIRSQNGDPIPEATSFNVWVAPNDASTFLHTATASNSIGSATWLDHPVTNSDPQALVWVTQNQDPEGDGDIINNHEIGVYYNDFFSKWMIFNQDLAEIPEDASFNVTVMAPFVFSDGFESGNTAAWSTVAP